MAIGPLLRRPAVCLGTVVSYNDPTLLSFIDGTASGGGTSAAVPYEIAMERLKISGLPHLINAIIMTSVFSCGKGVLFAASRVFVRYGRSRYSATISG
jgi:amino acid transporter